MLAHFLSAIFNLISITIINIECIRNDIPAGVPVKENAQTTIVAQDKATMSTQHFNITKHVIPASHIREYPRSLASDSQEDSLQIAIKQYSPKDQKHADEGDITFIGGHANAFPKELYEPLWDDLYARLTPLGIRISNIWIADVAFQGESGVLNENKLGNDPSWLDHPRDLLLMVNHFAKQMKRPIFGIGHSMGGNNLVNLSLMHNRLFESLILIDPVIQKTVSSAGNYHPAMMSTKRRDRWPSRREAEGKFRRNAFYQTWDSRVLDLWIEYGLRDLPTALYPQPQTSKLLPPVSADPSTASAGPEKTTEREVTLRTTKHQEVLSFLRANFPTPSHPDPSTNPNPITHPDVNPSEPPSSPFYRPEPLITFTKLPNLRPSVLYIFGDQSALSHPDMIAEKLAVTGTGVSGSGGVAKGRVKQVTFEGVGHLIPMEAVTKTANAIASWVEPELARWRANEEKARAEWRAVPKEKKSQMSDEFVQVMTSDWKEKLAVSKSKL